MILLDQDQINGLVQLLDYLIPENQAPVFGGKNFKVEQLKKIVKENDLGKLYKDKD